MVTENFLVATLFIIWPPRPSNVGAKRELPMNISNDINGNLLSHYHGKQGLQPYPMPIINVNPNYVYRTRLIQLIYRSSADQFNFEQIGGAD